MRIGALLAMLCSLIYASTASADLVESTTGVRFYSQIKAKGAVFQCLGAGVLYTTEYHAVAVTYCVEEEQVALVRDLARLAHPNSVGRSLARALSTNQEFFDAITQVPGAKLVIMCLTQQVSAPELAMTFKQALTPDIASDKAQQLADALAHDGAKGGMLLVFARGSRIIIDTSAASTSIEDESVGDHLWRVWLGPRSISPSLKESISLITATTAGQLSLVPAQTY